MSGAMIVLLACGVIALVIGVALAARGSGPHVTTIETKREREKDDDDDA